MAYALLFVVGIAAAATLYMRLHEGGWFLDRWLSPDAAIGASFVALALLLNFWGGYSFDFWDSGTTRGWKLRYFAAVPGCGLALAIYPEIFRASTADWVTLKWARGLGWVLMIGALCIALVARAI